MESRMRNLYLQRMGKLKKRKDQDPGVRLKKRNAPGPGKENDPGPEGDLGLALRKDRPDDHGPEIVDPGLETERKDPDLVAGAEASPGIVERNPDLGPGITGVKRARKVDEEVRKRMVRRTRSRGTTTPRRLGSRARV